MRKRVEKANRIYVRGTGDQATYDVGDVIDDFAPTKAGLKKAVKLANCWMIKPAIDAPECLSDEVYSYAIGNNTLVWKSEGRIFIRL